MFSKTTTRLAAFALLSLAAVPSASADIPPPVDCTGKTAGAGCVLDEGDQGICVEQSGSLVCETACDSASSGSGCCDLAHATCCGTNANNGVCKSVPGGFACDSTNSQVCSNKTQGASCKTGAGQTGTCETTGDSGCSFLTCTPPAGTTSSTSGTTSSTSGSSTSGTTGTSGGGGDTSGTTGTTGTTSGGQGTSGSSHGCALEGPRENAPLGMGFLAAALGATALGRRRGNRRPRRP